MHKRGAATLYTNSEQRAETCDNASRTRRHFDEAVGCVGGPVRRFGVRPTQDLQPRETKARRRGSRSPARQFYHAMANRPTSTEWRLAAALGAFYARLERPNDFLRLLGTSRRFALKARENRRIPASVQPRHIAFKRRRRRPAQLSYNSINRSSSLERPVPGQHLIDDQPECIHVRGGRSLSATQLFRRHIRQRADHLTRFRKGRITLRQP